MGDNVPNGVRAGGRSNRRELDEIVAAVVSRDRMLSEIREVADDVDIRTVDAHIRNLRKKIGRDRISTIIGDGYRFETAASR